MKILKSISLIAILVSTYNAGTGNCTDVKVPLSDKNATSSVSPLMHKNFQALMDLQQYVANPEDFLSDKNSSEIEKNLNLLSEVAKTLPKMISREKPGLTVISELFSDYILSTQKNFKAGYKDFSRLQLRTITGFCMACHTSGESAKQFQVIENLESLKAMTPTQKADFYAATRQFDKALNAYEQVVTNGVQSTEKSVIDVARAIRSYLSISIRVMNDAKKTYGFLVKAEHLKGGTTFFSKDVAQWKSDTSDWVKEKFQDLHRVPVSTLLAKSSSLINKARSKQLFPADRTGDVNFLRASVYAHAAADRAQSTQDRSQAYYLLGRAYAALSDPFLWELDGLYFEACIRAQPHSTQSRQCFKQLASGIYLGYSGSSGVNIPEEDLERLAKLRRLAE